MRARSAGRLIAVLLALVAGAAVIATPPTDDSGRPRADEVALLRARAAASFQRVDGRPPYRPRPPVAVGLGAPAGAPEDVYGAVQTVTGPREELRLAFADGALPFSYVVDPELVERAGLGTVVEAMSAWDGVDGSRWRTRFDGVSRRPLDESYADGVSTVHLRNRCPAGLLGSVRWQLDPAVATLDVRGGTGAVFTSEVDIAVCPRADTPERVRHTLVHEVGHVLGLEHLCRRGDPCPPALDGLAAECRVMHWHLQPCGDTVREVDQELARHLYPTLPRLWGPTPTDTAVRTSYATVDTGAARRVVLARTDVHPWQLAPVLLETAPDDAPLLFAEGDLGGCVPEPAGGELARVAAPGALVTLVGSWPPTCEALLASWALRVERRNHRPAGDNLTGAERMAAQLGDADRVIARHRADGLQPRELVLAALPSGVHDGALLGEETASAWSAAALAAAIRAPLVFVAGTRLPDRLAEWLTRHPEIRVAHAVGGTDALSPLLLHDLRRRGLTTTRVPGVSPSRVTAGTVGLFPGTSPVFVAPVDAPAEQAVAASLAMRVGGPLTVVADSPRPLRDVLAPRRPRGGALVAGAQHIPARLHWALTRTVLPAQDPRLDVEWRSALSAPGGRRPPSGRRIGETVTTSR